MVKNIVKLYFNHLNILVGFYKPPIGSTFGILLFAILQGGIIPITFGEVENERKQDLKWLSLFSGVGEKRYDIFRTYAQPPYIVGANGRSPLQIVYNLIFCVSPDLVRIRARTKNFLLLLLFLLPSFLLTPEF
ncbi:MAG: hypothetical protein F6K17_23035 [Okeania sp. SIO3C4]|nr:hypothetical protein [Okeania sp. SIO3B3]NER05260.1 hypothetical protein [Okeania sp. SIO3C4]